MNMMVGHTEDESEYEVVALCVKYEWIHSTEENKLVICRLLRVRLKMGLIKVE